MTEYSPLSEQAKLLAGGYRSLGEVEGDHKRMITNAKAYNERTSSVYDDAERMRKTAYNFMSKHNPLYKDKDYVSVATPIPDGSTNGTPIRNGPQRESNGKFLSKGAPPTPLPPKSTPAPLPKVNGNAPVKEENGDKEGFAGLTFQQAQDKIITDLMDYKDPK